MRIKQALRQIMESYKKGSAMFLPAGKEMLIPSRTAVVQFIDRLFVLLYPGYHGISTKGRWQPRIKKTLKEADKILSEQIFRAMRIGCEFSNRCEHCRDFVHTTTERFWALFPEFRRSLDADVRAALDGDPAARSFEEIVLAYPGLYAVTIYRLAHGLNLLEVPLLPRMMTEHAHERTGIDIHPGALIGERFFIDHGTGVVVGETTNIGRNVKLYQGVTLGALSFKVDERGRVIREGKRHPTIEDDVVIYAGATILGGKTVIGRGSIIGGNTWVTHSIPAGSRVINEAKEQRIDSMKELG